MPQAYGWGSIKNGKGTAMSESAWRSNAAETRNPVLRLLSPDVLQSLPPDSKEALRVLLLALRADAQINAEKCWRKHKAPMAAYWKAVAVYAGHTSRILRPAPQLSPEAKWAQW
jgi:hypothetical protein